MSSAKKRDKKQEAELNDPELEEFAEVLVKSFMATPIEPEDAFENYARELIARLHDEVSFKKRFLNGYQSLLEELRVNL